MGPGYIYAPIEVSRRTLEGWGRVRSRWRRDRWRWFCLSEAINETRRDLTSENLLWRRRVGTRVRSRVGDWVSEGAWVCDQWKKERRVVGWEARDLDEKIEMRRLSVRWGMYELRALRGGVVLEVRIVVIVCKSWGWVIPDIVFMFLTELPQSRHQPTQFQPSNITK